MKSAVAYARFSSDLQREESIDAQVRAIKYFASQSGFDIIRVYADKAMSGRSSDRPQFLQMIADSANKDFSTVFVHKLDRFSRDSTDALYFERVLNKNGVELISINEKLDKTPEGALMKMVIAGMNEFYSLNLARETMKGLKENAYKAKHTGGTPPLGFDLDEEKRYVINEKEAEAVKMIFNMYIAGHGYRDVMNALNANGYKTKRGGTFSKNSLHDILKNEKYTGVFVFNKRVSRDISGKFNGHKYKDDSQIIKVEDGIPKIISKEIFTEVQKKMKERQHKSAQYKAKTFYLLSGLLTCGDCNNAMSGETRRYSGKEYFYYICAKNSRSNECERKTINRDLLNNAVIKNLNDKIFNKKTIKNICERIYESYQKNDVEDDIKKYKREIASTNLKINNLYAAIEKGLDSEETLKRINERKQEKNQLELKIIELKSVPGAELKSVQELEKEFRNVSLADLSPQAQKRMIQRFVSNIIVYGNRKKGIKIRVVVNPNRIDLDGLLDMNGGEGALPPISKTACYYSNGLVILDFPLSLVS